MTQERATSNDGTAKTPYQKVLSESYYGLLGLHPSASVREIRQAYRDLSKLYHPDTTVLPTAIATSKFQQLNEAYATLSSPERRTAYDRKIGYSSVAVVQPLPTLNRPVSRNQSYSSSAYLDPTDRPLSPGEIFALFILGITFLGCLVLAIAIGLTRGDTVLPSVAQPPSVPQVIISGTPAKTATSNPLKTDLPNPAGRVVDPENSTMEPNKSLLPPISPDS
ncbi:MAG: J domain-containing protein [Leptolyngbyaceae cyanobacterium bins.302]|nr:J domain-containing protein [Leptolyngbyaceae cyanobacterium bins.302]